MTADRPAPVDEAKPNQDRTTLRNTIGAFAPLAERYWARPLGEYAAAIFDHAQQAHQISVRAQSLSLLTKRLKMTGLARGYTQSQCQDLERQLSAAPVIQTGPHNHLLIDPDAIYTSLFSLLGILANASRWQIWFSASTVKLTERAQKGPGWLEIGNHTANIFGLSRRQAARYHVLSGNGPYRFQLSLGQTPLPDDDATAVLDLLPKTAYSSATEAIKAANLKLWAHCFDETSNLLQVDDFDVADLIADHLEDEKSWLSQKLFKNNVFIERLHTARRDLNNGGWSGWVKETTDLFWGIADHRLVPLRLKDSRLAHLSGSKFSMSFRRQTVIDGLRDRSLVPDLFMTFLVIGILPGIRVLGGCKQIIYYPLMRHLLAQSLDPDDDRALIGAMRADIHPSVWGHRVLVPKEPAHFDVLRKGWALELARVLGSRSLFESCGDLPRFANDPLWVRLSELTASRHLSRYSDEWQWGDYR